MENENLLLRLTAEEAGVVSRGLMFVAESDLGPVGNKAMALLLEIKNAIVAQDLEES